MKKTAGFVVCVLNVTGLFRKEGVREALKLATLFLTTCGLAAGNAFPYTTTTLSIDPANYPDVTLYIPAGYDPGTPTPLLVLLHGYSSTGADTEGYLQFLTHVDTFGYLYAIPTGRTDSYGNPFWDAHDSCCDRDGVPNTDEDSAYLRSMIEEIRDQHNVDENRVFITGHSNGGMMAHRMACDHAGIVAAIASLAGIGYYDASLCAPSAPVHVLQIHGDADSIVLYGGGTFAEMGGLPYIGAVETITDWLTRNGCDTVLNDTEPDLNLLFGPWTDTVVSRYTTGCDLAGSADLWTMPGASHGPSLRQPAFATTVLDFFFSHPKQRIRFDDSSAIRWAVQPAPGSPYADSYNVYRGYLSGLSAGNYGTCISQSDSDDTDGECPDTDIPDPGSGFFYLTTYDNYWDGVEGKVGKNSAGNQRLQPPACP